MESSHTIIHSISNFIPEARPFYRGTAKVRLQNLKITDTDRATISFKNVDRLIRIFDEEGCDRTQDPEHRVPVIISKQNLENALANSAPSDNGLYDGQIRSNFYLPDEVQLTVLHGKHRLVAASKFLPSHSEQWWIVDLFDDALPSDTATSIKERYSHSHNFCDGDIYRHIREYQLQGNETLTRKWIARLSKSKYKDFQQMCKRHPQLLAAFDRLMPLNGLWTALELGCLHRILNLHCPEENVRYLHYVFDIWQDILLNRTTLFTCLDSETVSILETLCPKYSAEDADNVRRLMANKEIFPLIDDSADRARMLDRILATDWPILSIHTYLEDTKVLELGTKPLHCLLPSLQTRSLDNVLRRRFDHIYHQPSSVNAPTVAIQSYRGRVEYAHCSKPLATRISFDQLVLYCLRFFDILTKFCPRRESGKSVPAPTHDKAGALWGLADLAYKLGYRSAQIDQIVNQNPDRESVVEFLTKIRPVEEYDISEENREIYVTDFCRLLNNLQQSLVQKTEDTPVYTTDQYALTKKYRCGRPHSDGYRKDRKFLFIDIIHKQYFPPRRSHITTFAVKRYTFLAFFGPYSLPQLDSDTDESWLSRSAISPEPSTENHSQPTKGEATASYGNHRQSTQVDDTNPGTSQNDFLGSSPITEPNKDCAEDNLHDVSSVRAIHAIPIQQGEFQSVLDVPSTVVKHLLERETGPPLKLYLPADKHFTTFGYSHKTDFINFIISLANKGYYFIAIQRDRTLGVFTVTDLSTFLDKQAVVVALQQSTSGEMVLPNAFDSTLHDLDQVYRN